ncbi:calcium-binding protein [Nocardioides sp.]|uniref:calcium-binding protein n=1 Tax=Nocardioides sp. TaxID=35761 RepID=UPI002CD75451|nr:calcium-binding protein [Nocardioides sp.]HXH79760.1 calcium-binding protein [Nocardioides sp.]
MTALTFTALVTGVLLTPPATAVAKVETCQGRPATIVGSGPAVVGTPGDDVIVSGASKVVSADAGNDLICLTYNSGPSSFETDAGEGDDVIDASQRGPDGSVARLGSGRDRYVGGDAVDFVYADGLDDEVSTGFGYDEVDVTVVSTSTGVRGHYDAGTGPEREKFTLRGAAFDIGLDLDGPVVFEGVMAAELAGFDKASLYAHRAVVGGNSESNYLEASGCDLRIDGEVGNDRLFVMHPSGADDSRPRCETSDRRTRMSGGRGKDIIYGRSGPDRIEGNAGNDRILGRDASDVLLGGSGDDYLKGNDGRDVLRGNSGNDTLLGSSDRDTADGNAGRDSCTAETERTCEV